jgi:hypothetical protein
MSSSTSGTTVGAGAAHPRPVRRPPVPAGLLSGFGIALLVLGTPAAGAGAVRSPEEAFGFRLGSDKQLVSWEQEVDYLAELTKGSDKLRLLELGSTTMGKRLIAVVISAPQNLAALDRHRQIARALADPRVTSEEAAATLAAEGRVIVAIGCSNHASELAAAQMAPELVHQLVTDDSPRTRRILGEVIVLLFPSMNPDGMDLVVDWYKSSLGQPWEGEDMPWLYSKYVGHDINRDFFMLTQVENRRFADVFYREWRPQVFLTMHQMGGKGSRFFVPPNYESEPVDPNYEPLLWREAGLLGHAMATEMEARGLKGVITNALYDYFFPGYEDSGPLGHNTVCLLTEAASAKLATPMDVSGDELLGTPKGLPEYGIRQNHPNPWEGGTWRLRDIVDYEETAVLSLLDMSARYREELLRNFHRMARNQIEKGRREPPFAFVVPAGQRDPLTAVRMIDILRLGAVEVWKAKAPFEADGHRYPAASYVIRMDQPNRAYAKTLLERQTYPARRLLGGGPTERPYDVTGWTLPLQMGVEVVAAQHAFEFQGEPVERAAAAPVALPAKGAALVLPAELNDSILAVNRILKQGGRVFRAPRPLRNGTTLGPGAFVVPLTGAQADGAREQVRRLAIPALTLPALPGALTPLSAPRVGLYKPWTANIDEGWTRWLLEQYEFSFTNLSDADVRAGRLHDRFDVVILPSVHLKSILEGRKKGTVPQEYAGGIGTEGVASLRVFVEEGGTLVALGASSELAIERLRLPVRDALAGVKPEAFSCPGSILRTRVDPTHPVAFGMPEESIAVFGSGSAFEVAAGFGPTQPRVVVQYPEAALLLSGWIEGESWLAGKAAAVDAPVGRGHVILLGFGVQQRAQPHATFKLLFNALYYHGSAARPDAAEVRTEGEPARSH